MTEVKKATLYHRTYRATLHGAAATHRAEVNKRRLKLEVVRKYRSLKGCATCGEKHPAALDFHHRDRSTKSGRLKWGAEGGQLSWNRLPWVLLLIEIDKCDVLCANCHRKQEWEDNVQRLTEV